MGADPPNYRYEEEVPGLPTIRCADCVHERSYRGRVTCLRYFVRVRLNRVCDDWNEDQPVIFHQRGAVAMFYHNSSPSQAEKQVLAAHEITEVSTADDL